MNRGIEIILARMESNPEEFAPKNYTIGGATSKWESVIEQWKPWLDQEDIDAFYAGLRQVRQDLFTEKVMKELLNPTDLVLREISQHPYTSTTGSTGLALGGAGTGATWASTLNVGDEQLNSQELRALKEMKEEYMRRKKEGSL